MDIDLPGWLKLYGDENAGVELTCFHDDHNAGAGEAIAYLGDDRRDVACTRDLAEFIRWIFAHAAIHVRAHSQPARQKPGTPQLVPVVNAMGQVLMRHRLCGTLRWLIVEKLPEAPTSRPMDAVEPDTRSPAICSYCSGSFLHSDYWTITYQAEGL